MLGNHLSYDKMQHCESKIHNEGTDEPFNMHIESTTSGEKIEVNWNVYEEWKIYDFYSDFRDQREN